eukprot:TRINITY_DN12207_c2_g1_i7.p1 TRINITY_DN12207_c2_g1~~TRINITY_DN12207_c2_g1_i7.p1  ORF type:complete len:365 (+),score=89.71 TRINITY_DN12207_c2_g1_i7:420-1514(+)
MCSVSSVIKRSHWLLHLMHQCFKVMLPLTPLSPMPLQLPEVQRLISDLDALTPNLSPDSPEHELKQAGEILDKVEQELLSKASPAQLEEIVRLQERRRSVLIEDNLLPHSPARDDIVKVLRKSSDLASAVLAHGTTVSGSPPVMASLDEAVDASASLADATDEPHALAPETQQAVLGVMAGRNEENEPAPAVHNLGADELVDLAKKADEHASDSLGEPIDLPDLDVNEDLDVEVKVGCSFYYSIFAAICALLPLLPPVDTDDGEDKHYQAVLVAAASTLSTIITHVLHFTPTNDVSAQLETINNKVVNIEDIGDTPWTFNPDGGAPPPVDPEATFDSLTTRMEMTRWMQHQGQHALELVKQLEE